MPDFTNPSTTTSLEMCEINFNKPVHMKWLQDQYMKIWLDIF